MQAVPQDAQFIRIPRSREVGQSYITAIWSTLVAFVACLKLVFSLQPQLVLVNGPGTCLPICIAAAIMSILRLQRCKIVFVESICRVQSLSLTGKLLYHSRLADAIHVQWPELVKRYPRCEYVGMLL